MVKVRNRTHIVIAAGILCGLLFPRIEPFKTAIPYLIVVILTFNFFEIEVEWKNFFRLELLLTVALSAAAMPLLYYLLLSKGLDTDYRIGILLTAMAPSGVMALVLGRFVRELDYDLVLSNFLITTFGAVLYLPLMVKWLAGSDISVPTTQLLYKTALMILLPYGIGAILKIGVPAPAAAMLKRCSQPVILALLFVICAVVAGGASQRIELNLSILYVMVLVFSVYLVQGGLAYGIGWFFWGKPVRRTLALVSSSRNNQITLGIAVINFPPAAALPCIFGFIFHHVTNAVWLWLLRK